MPHRIPYVRLPGQRAKRPKPPDRRAAKKERDKFYASLAWRRLRAAHLAANPLCEPCLAQDKLVEATIVHHVKERLDAPDEAFDSDNLQSICSPCHTAHHKKLKQQEVKPA